MNIKNELQIALPDFLFARFKDEYFIHIAECLNKEKDMAKRRTALNEYIAIVIDEAGKIELEHQLSRAIYSGNRFLLKKYKGTNEVTE